MPRLLRCREVNRAQGLKDFKKLTEARVYFA